ncbi:MAG: triose-phosphate isomerase [Arenibacterium sp.]
MRQKLAAGNWKMNGTGAALNELTALAEAHKTPACDILICPPATLISRAATHVAGSSLQIGAQDCHANESGAHTGDLSAQMLQDAGASYVITGHSERRQDHGESDAHIRAKSEAALKAGMSVILCIGESLKQRQAGQTLDVLAAQLKGSLPANADGETLIIAYEPIWAIGTGEVASLEQIADVHRFLRDALTTQLGADTAQAIRLLYGGSVKAGNAAEIFGVKDVDGALVGGASLTAEDFSPIVSALEASA